MRTVPAHITDLWEVGGPFIGEDGVPSSRVTIDVTPNVGKANGWWLRTQAAVNFPKGPVRWWQRKTQTQVEAELPNILEVDIDRSFETDAASCTITLANQWHFSNGSLVLDSGELSQGGQLGAPGYFSFSRGDADAAARWGQVASEWSEVLVPNAMLRIYQGYGGKTKTISDAIDDGNLILTGIFLIDDLAIGTDGNIRIRCRDMAKLLIEQFIFPPLVPKRYFPLVYCWHYYSEGANPEILYGNSLPPSSGTFDRSDVVTFSATSDGTGDVAQMGHFPHETLDLKSNTYWLSSGAPTSDSWRWFEINVGEQINAIGWGCASDLNDDYRMYVSIMESGVWVGTALLPPEADSLAYIMEAGISTEGGLLQLDRTYSAEKVRFTFTHLTQTQWPEPGTPSDFYRVGMSELAVGRMDSNLPTKDIVGGVLTSTDRGYWIVGSDGGVFAFGPDGNFYGSSGGGGTDNPWRGITATSTDGGYWTVRSNGYVYNFGDAVHYGDARWLVLAAEIAGIDRTGDNAGYWLIGVDGGVLNYGSAVLNGTGSGGLFMDITRRGITNDEYWMLRADGVIQASTGTPTYGDVTGFSGTPTAIATTPSGNGYYVATTTGEVYAFGDAVYAGGANTPEGRNGAASLADDISDIAVLPDNSGYILVGEDGGIFNYGSTFWGSLPDDYGWETQRMGNADDYTTIIKELLLWSGFWLHDEDYIAGGIKANRRPMVYGNIEYTGIMAEDCISEEVFDKKQVIDAINYLKEIVGYNFWIDEEGAARFESPNFWRPGNWMEDGTWTNRIPEIDERQNLMSYSITYNDNTARSKIIISSSNPTENAEGTVTTEYIPHADIPMVRGMCRPLMWVNENLVKEFEQTIMAELVAAHLFAARRSGEVKCVWTPEIQLGDQVRILERITGETYVHYVKSINSSHDLSTGEFTMTIGTYWLGSDSDTWIFNIDPPVDESGDTFSVVTEEVLSLIVPNLLGNREIDVSRI